MWISGMAVSDIPSATQWHCIKTWPTLAMKIRWLPSWLATSPSMFLELWGMSLYAPFGFEFLVMDFYCRCWLFCVMFDQIQYPFWVVDIIELPVIRSGLKSYGSPFSLLWAKDLRSYYTRVVLSHDSKDSTFEHEYPCLLAMTSRAIVFELTETAFPSFFAAASHELRAGWLLQGQEDIT